MKLRVVVGLIAATLLLSAGGILTWAWTEDRPLDTSVTATFRIPPGEALGQTAERLVQARLVRSAVLFRVLFQWSSGEGSFPSGTFSVPGGLSVRQAVEYFHHAQPLQVRVTIPEGWTASKIARLLEEKHIVTAEQFLAVVHDPARIGALGAGLTTLEGRLFPDTYQFPLEVQPEDVVRTLVSTFHERTSQWTGSSDEWNRRLVLASIVEREYRNADEAPLIASVFDNRLARGIPLGSCATIEYILTEVLGRPHPKRIFFVHTEIPSPYNTYLNKGLPPAPISNPGLTSLKAVFEPVVTPYLYFVVADSTKGTHTFSSNWAQHEKAREAYLNNFVTKG